MSEQELDKEIKYLDTLTTAQRKDYLYEAERARGIEVAAALRAALIVFWRSIK